VLLVANLDGALNVTPSLPGSLLLPRCRYGITFGVKLCHDLLASGTVHTCTHAHPR
jgi:hypothetical protein